MKSAVIAIAKLENNYIREWVEWYKNIGFTNVIIYDNNDVDGERIADAIPDYVTEGFAIIEPFYGKKHAQHDAYQKGYDKYGREYEWIAFFDIDEYLSLNPRYKNVEDYLSKFHPLVDLVRVSWRLYGDNGLVRVENGDYSVVNRFKEPLPDEKQPKFTKAIVRGGLNLVIGRENDETPHIVRALGVNIAVDANGNQVNNYAIQDGCGYENAALNHYTTKTIEEYVLNKVKKGWAVGLSEDLLNLDYFFTQNDRTDEKVALYEQLTGIKWREPKEIRHLDKKLYFYLWVSPDFDSNIAIKTHKICLKRYINVFDELNFIISVDDYGNAEQIDKGIAWIRDVCGEKKFNARLVLNNKEICEVGILGEYFFPRIEMEEDSMLFLGHTKGIMDVHHEWRNKYSILRWIVSMYYYNLEYAKEAEEYLSNGKTFYGALKTHFQRLNNSGIMTHGNIYIGTFYWMNPANAKKNMISDLKEASTHFNRWIAEDFPMLFNEETMASHNNAVTENIVADLYFQKKEDWPKYLDYYGDSDILFKTQNEIIKEVCGEE